MRNQRIVGQEVEYGILMLPNNEQIIAQGTTYYDVVGHLYTPDSRFSFSNGNRAWSSFLANGAKFYSDTGGHPEYATPECLGARQLVCADQAGDRFLERVQNRANQRLKERGYQHQIYLYKNNSDGKETWGCHENYLVEPRFFDELTNMASPSNPLKILMTYLVSGVIYTGNGSICNYLDGSFHFHVSQRADNIWYQIVNSTTGNRPIVNARNEPLCQGWRRLHITSRDSNMSPLQTYLKFGTCSIILDILEASRVWLNPKLVLTDPVIALHQFAADPTLEHKAECENGKRYTALELQKIFLEQAAKFVQGYGSEEDKKVIAEWERVLDALSNLKSRPGLLIGEIDWLTKKAVIEKKIRQLSGYSEERAFDLALKSNKKYEFKGRLCSLADIAKTINVQYHDIRRDKGLFYLFAGKNNRPLLTDEEIEELIDRPPEGARAELRGFLIRECEKNNENRYYLSFDWNLCAFMKQEIANQRIRNNQEIDSIKINIFLDNPYDYRLSEEACLKLTLAGLLKKEEIPERLLPLRRLT